MTLRLLIKGDAIQYGENDFYCPCRTIDIEASEKLIDTVHEHIIGVEIIDKHISGKENDNADSN